MTDSDPSDTFEIFGVTLSECQTCGQAMVGTKPTCEDCAGKVPVEALQELIAGWERVGDTPEPEALCERNKGVYEATIRHAQELQALIDDYSNE